MTTQKQVSLIVATLLPNFGIGYKNKLPWRLRNEMKYFKKVTTTNSNNKINAVVMGRKTWESIPEKFRPLPGRYNVVLTRQDTSELPVLSNLSYSHTIEDALQGLEKNNEIERIFIIGGAEIYDSALKSGLVDHLLVTEVESAVEAADIEMDTFLDRAYIDANFEKLQHSALQHFIGIDVDPEPVSEGDLHYRYTLYKRIQR